MPFGENLKESIFPSFLTGLIFFFVLVLFCSRFACYVL
jgi:hypothetical protein